MAPGESPVGGLAGSGIHQLDAIIHLAGSITQVYALSLARIHDVPLDDTTLVSFRLASDGAASLTTLTATAPLYRLTVFGNSGRAQLDGAAERLGSEILAFTRLDGSSETRTFAPFDTERVEIEAFAGAISGAEPYPVSHDEILNGVAAFEAVSLSVQRGAPVAVD